MNFFLRVQFSIKKRRAIVLLLLPAMAVSCTHTPGKKSNDKVAEKIHTGTVLPKPPSSFSDTEQVQFPAINKGNPLFLSIH